MNLLGIISHLLQSYGYYAVFAFIALESLGVPLPGESTLIAAALYAGSTHHLSIGIVFATAACAAIAGDNAGYWLGRVGGQRLVQRYGHHVRLDATKLKVGRYLFARHGGKVVFWGRFITLLRTYAAFFAGMNQMRWPAFLANNAAGGLLWAAVYAFGAYSLGSAATQVGSTLTIVGLVLTTVLTALTAMYVKRSIGELTHRAQAAYADPDTSRVSGQPVLVH